MHKTLKLTLAATALAACAIPLGQAKAENISYSAKGAYIQASAWGGTGMVQYIYVSDGTTNSKGTKEKHSYGYIYGYYTPNENECWTGWGSIENATVSYKKNSPATASGTVDYQWTNYCDSSQPTFNEPVSFNLALTPLTTDNIRSWGSTHTEYGFGVRVNRTYNETFAPADVGTSSITSPAFGTAPAAEGYVGTSKSHDVQISR